MHVAIMCQRHLNYSAFQSFDYERVCSVCYLRILVSNPMLNTNMTGVTSGVGSTLTTGTPEFTLGGLGYFAF